MNPFIGMFTFLILFIIFVFSIIIYDGVVEQPKRNAYCKSLNGEVLWIPQSGDFCRTKDGRLLDIKR